MADVLVTFRRLRSGATHQVKFRCGAGNGLLILREAWNAGSEIVEIQPLQEDDRG
ncbi:MAG: hypothetical protein Q8K55_11395 [Gemmatimonadaceae bacterium]|nr:hypothetical protein [Gemmatimonadaceae bacterium]